MLDSSILPQDMLVVSISWGRVNGQPVPDAYYARYEYKRCQGRFLAHNVAAMTSDGGRVGEREMRMTLVAAVLGLLAGGAAVAEQPEPTARMRPCSETAGPERAALLVRQCLQVSPATRPPCNAENTCGLILDEIKRGCEFFRKGQAGTATEPAFCKEHLPPAQ